jgi:prepilin-type N-terminal cleavage/methylation domain-containing protein
MRNRRGFTLIEVIVALGIVSIVAFVAVPFSFSQISANRVVDAASDLSSGIFRAQQDAYASKEDKSYGIRFTEFDYQFFSTVAEPPVYPGSSDFTVSLADGIRKTNDTTVDLIFPKSTFRPKDLTPIQVTLTDGTSNVVVEINSEGLINYYQE